MFGHLAARSKVYDGIAVQKGDSMQQIVFLGAGYDTRAYRMETLKRLPVYEVDAPGTGAVKSIKLQNAGISGDNVIYVSVDFESQSFTERLKQFGFDSSLRTLWIWEV